MQDNEYADLPNLPKDPYMLLSIINMKLRDYDGDLNELCKREDIDIKTLKNKLKSAGFEYVPSLNQFR